MLSPGTRATRLRNRDPKRETTHYQPRKVVEATGALLAVPPEEVLVAEAVAALAVVAAVAAAVVAVAAVAAVAVSAAAAAAAVAAAAAAAVAVVVVVVA